MRFGITHKLFLALLLSNVVVIVLMAAAVRWSFQKGFLDYVEQVEIRRLDPLAEALESAYGRYGGWAFLKGDARVWRDFIRQNRGWHGAPGTGMNGMMGPEPGMMGPAHMERMHIVRRLSLLDADRSVVVGNPAPARGAALRPLVRDGRTVGWLSIAPPAGLTDRLDRSFQASQSHTFHVIAAIAILVAALGAMVAARGLLKPVRRLADGTRALTSGRFDTRITPTSRDELGQLADDFNTLAHTLEQNRQARNQFMADISHELRTPLSVLRGEIEALQDGVRTFDAAAVKSLHAEVMRLHKLVDDLYQLSLSDAGALSYARARLDLAELLRDAVDSYRERFVRRDIAVELSIANVGPYTAFGDGGRLYQCFTNLLENALRYTDSGGRLRVTLEAHGALARIGFQDSAPGVPEDARPRLFDRLYRVEASRNRAGGGAGLGLTICRNIIDAHGGRITAHASPLGGVWIDIELPLNRAS